MGFENPAQRTRRVSAVDSDAPLTQRIGFVGGDMELEAELTRSVARHAPAPADTAPGASLQYVLRVQMAEENWEPFTFSGSQSLEQQAVTFLQRHALKPAFQGGLIEKMQQM